MDTTQPGLCVKGMGTAAAVLKYLCGTCEDMHFGVSYISRVISTDMFSPESMPIQP